ncbi:MAG: hypothetical protein AAGA30_11775 [Planctomycetota bacterium]
MVYSRSDEAEIIFLNEQNYPEYRDKILEIQKRVYDPVQQNPPEEFDSLFTPSEISPLAIAVLHEQQIIAMATCGPIGKFQQRRGVATDPWLNAPAISYMLDLTIEQTQPTGLSRVLKNAIVQLAASRGITAIHGRNRDRLGREMWAINLSLGAFEIQHLPNDHSDEHEQQDCFYYRLPIAWNPSHPKELPFLTVGKEQLTPDYVRRNAPTLVNKVCLSNFVNEEFLMDLTSVSKTLPDSLQRIYTSSSLSEAVDKMAKAIWLGRKPANKLATVEGHYFGEGSFLSRTLSGIGDPYFDAARLDQSNELPAQLKELLQEEKLLAFFVEPRKFADQTNLLAECVRVCRENKTPIVYNETGPEFGTTSQFSRIPELTPCGGIAWLGGAMALTYCSHELFVDDPLMLISTWDGDAYSLARFAEAMRQHHD